MDLKYRNQILSLRSDKPLTELQRQAGLNMQISLRDKGNEKTLVDKSRYIAITGNAALQAVIASSRNNNVLNQDQRPRITIPRNTELQRQAGKPLGKIIPRPLPIERPLSLKAMPTTAMPLSLSRINNIEKPSKLPNNLLTNLLSVKLEGGLGNRIFKILAGLGISEKYSKKFVICKQFIRNGNVQHENNLDAMISSIFPNLTYINSFNGPYEFFNNYDGFTSTEIIIPAHTNVLIQGIFQNEMYFPSESYIPKIKTAYYFNKYFIHIRAGDYLNSSTFSLNLVEYYKKCIEILGPGVKYIVFSNDNTYAHDYIKKMNVDIDYIISNEENQLKVLIEMANCAGGICANSSFSWLGAFFQGGKRGKIFMPSIWLNIGYNCDGVYPAWATVINIDSTMVESKINDTNLFDIVIPVGPNDSDILINQLIYTKNNIIGYRNIYIIYAGLLVEAEGCISISEKIFPFSIDTVAKYHGKSSRNGWYLQQLLKLYAGNIIPGILDKYLVIDCDTFFLKKTRFIHNGKCLYAYGNEYHKPYFNHMYKLCNSFKKMISHISGICHHMIFETIYINEIISIVETKYNDQFFNVFLKLVDTSSINLSGASEYELYFNYILQYHINNITIRTLKWDNCKQLTSNSVNDFESIHWHIRSSLNLRICCLMFYNYTISEYGDIAYKLNSKYCNTHNIDIIVSKEITYTNRHPAWEKLPLVLKYIKAYDYIIWIDADAFFYNNSPNISSIIENNIDANFIFSNDKNNNNINSGVFIVKNTDYSVQFLNKWAYDEYLYNNNTCKGWWEQGVLIDMFDKNIMDIKANSICYDYGILQHFREDELSFLPNHPFILHLAGSTHVDRVNIFRKYT